MTTAINYILQEAHHVVQATTHKNACKLLRYSIQWGQMLSEAIQINPISRSAFHAISLSVATCGSFEAFSSVLDTTTHAWTYILAPSWDNFSEIFSESCNFLTSLPDISSWGELSKVFPGFISYTPLSLTVSCAALYLSCTDTYKSYHKLDTIAVEEKESPLEKHLASLQEKCAGKESAKLTLDHARYNLYMRIAKDISYFALGVFMILSTLHIYTMHKTLDLSIKSAALIGSIASAYFGMPAPAIN